MPTSKAPVIAALIIISATASFLTDAVELPEGQSQPPSESQSPPQDQPAPPPQSQPAAGNAPLDPAAQPQPQPPAPRTRSRRSRRSRRAPGNTTALERKRAMEVMAREFVLAHNAVRANYSEPPLKWDRAVARYAQRYANKRKADCNLTHSSNGPYGENIFWGLHTHWTPTEIVNKWAEEVKDYDWNTYLCVNNSMCGHFTQIVWRDTIRVGCARVVCDIPGLFSVCSYDPPGNYIGQSPFISSEPQPILVDDDSAPPPSSFPLPIPIPIPLPLPLQIAG